MVMITIKRTEYINMHILNKSCVFNDHKNESGDGPYLQSSAQLFKAIISNAIFQFYACTSQRQKTLINVTL